LVIVREERTGGLRTRYRCDLHVRTSEPAHDTEKTKTPTLTPRGERLTRNAHGTTLFTVASRPQPRRVRRAREPRQTLARYRGRTDSAYSWGGSGFAVRGSWIPFLEPRTSGL